ncbi:MAG: hypothetical protein QXF17_01515 [Ignisphaera sp.]|uniref:Uncharacterized protein n=1 Tax=Ignisphaera aggregans TaxID=334771 RepID=A0A7J3I5R9_9CREN
MSSSVKEFNNIGEFMKYIDDSIAELRRRLGEMLKKVEELRVKVEQEKKLRSILGRLGLPEPSSQNEIALRNIRIVVNPVPAQELTAYETAIESLNNRIMLLTAIRKEVEILGNIDVEIRLTVIYSDDIPKVVLLRFI